MKLKMKKEDNFSAGLRFIFYWEGELSSDPKDPGKLTIYGISSKSHPEAVKKMATLYLADRKEEAKEIAKGIYRREYWDKITGDNLPKEIGIVAFDCAVNQGVRRATKLILETTDWLEFILERYDYYDDLKLFNRYGKGWSRRMVSLYRYVKGGCQKIEYD